MSLFYDFYSNPGNQEAFKCFWDRNYYKAMEILEVVARQSDPGDALQLRDTLVYLYCLMATGGDYNSLRLNFPSPPSSDELTLLFNKEIAEERKSQSLINIPGTFLTQPRFLHKAILASKYGLDNSCTTVVETGTFLGESTYLFSGVFDFVHTVEADRSLYEMSSYWLGLLRKNIFSYNGNSGALLGEIIDSTTAKCLFFLDAHYSTGVTSRIYGICPLINELKMIFASPEKHVVVIDDTRCMGTRGYPSFKSIFAVIPEGRKMYIEYDQMIIV